MIAALSLDAATDSASFAAYLEQVLLPELHPYVALATNVDTGCILAEVRVVFFLSV
jgi:hypothetical protein